MPVIFCFTSTGNSLYAARKIAKEIGGQVLPATDRPTTVEDDVVGLVFPAFFWGTPNLVNRFVDNLTIVNPKAYFFAVVTRGGSAPGAAGELKKHLHGKRLAYNASVKMVENYVPMCEVDNLAQVHEAAEKDIERIARDIAQRKQNRLPWFGLMNRRIKARFPARHPDCDQKLKVSEACTGCGICAAVCPVENITISDGQPNFAHRCEHCISCLHACPVKAIDYGKTQNRERYIHPEIGIKGLIAFRQQANNSIKQEVTP